MANRQRIFVTGASSAVMQRFISRIDASAFEVIGLTRDLRGKTGSTAWVEGDLRDRERLEKYLKGCQIVIHGAAVTHARRPSEYFEINLQATRQLVDIANTMQVQKFIFLSSRAAVPGSGAYGISKLLAEQYVAANLENWLVFRLAELFGTTNSHDFITKRIAAALEKRVALCPVNLPAKLYPIHVDDAARVMHDLSFSRDIRNEVVTINGREGYTFRELLQCAADVYHRRMLMIPVPRCIMSFCGKLLESLSLDIGIAPDQIARLYCAKQTQSLDYAMISLKEFLQSEGRPSQDE